MPTLQTVTIKYVADTTSIKHGIQQIKSLNSTVGAMGGNGQQSFNKIANGANGATNSVGYFGAKIGIASSLMTGVINALQQGAQAFANFAKESITSASDFDENVNKTLAVFGEAGQKFIDQSGEMANRIGMSKNTYLESISLFGAIAKGLGITTNESLKMSDAMTGLAADLASFYNTDVEQAMTALKGALTGETEALKQFGIVANDTTMDAFVASQGKSWAAMTASEKAMSRYQYIMEQTKFIQGDYARTSDGVANSTRTLGEQIENLKIKIGQGLLPYFQKALGIANTFISALTTDSAELQTSMQKTNASIEETKQQLAELEAQGITTGDEYERLKSKLDGEMKVQANLDGVDKIKQSLSGIIPIVQEVGKYLKVLTTFSVGNLTTSLTALPGFFQAFRDLWEQIKIAFTFAKQQLDKLFNTIFQNSDGINNVLNGIKIAIQTIGYVIGTIAGIITFLIGGILGAVVGIINGIIAAVQFLYVQIVDGLQMLGQAWDESIGSWIGWLFGKLQELWNWFASFPENVKTWWNNMCQTLTNKWNEFVEWVKGINVVDAVFNSLKNVGSWLDANVLAPIKNWFVSLPSKLGSAVSNIGNWLGEKLNPANWFSADAMLNAQPIFNLSSNPDGNYGTRYNVQNINYNVYTNADPNLSFIANQKAIIDGGQGYGFNNNMLR